MRRHFFAAFVLIPAAVGAASYTGLFSSPRAAMAQTAAMRVAHECDERCKPDWMDAHLRMDQLQLVGTAESYKLRPTRSVMSMIRMGGKDGAQALDFGQPALATQLDHDVRALRFDVAYDPKGGAYKNPAIAGMAMELLPDDYIKAMAKPGFKTIHVLDVDYQSSCLALSDCLKEVADWSQAHPRHLPIVITLATNDAKTSMPGAGTPIACDEAALNALEDEVRAALPADQLITPNQLQGKYPSLREAALAHAWPRLDAARGKVIVVLDDSAAKVKAYQGARKSLEGRAMFVATDEHSPLAAFLSISDPVKDGARIRQAVQAGFMVVTRADDQTREARDNKPARRAAAFASGAQIIQTDFAAADPAIGPYRVSLADDAEALCGASLLPEHCVGFATPRPDLRTVAAAMP
jgi:hypothetical protein